MLIFGLTSCDETEAPAQEGIDALLQSKESSHGKAVSASHLAELQRKANRGDKRAEAMLVFHRDWQNGRYKESIPKLEKMATAGNVHAASLLIALYDSDGKEVKANFEKALHWRKVAAKLGAESAQRELDYYREQHRGADVQ